MRVQSDLPPDVERASWAAFPTVDEVEFRSLYQKTEYEVETPDGWALKIQRYKARPQPWSQPVLDEPLLLVHGFGQNRHAWTSGEFVKNLLYFGMDIHILELRGHGKSSVALQYRRARRRHRPVPKDVDYGWDIDSYFLHDLPAGIAGVKRTTGRSRIFLCGHSMGGMLGYGYAGLHQDLEGLITIGSAAELGAGIPLLRAAVAVGSASVHLVDLALAAINAERLLRHHAMRWASYGLGKVSPDRASHFRRKRLPSRLRFRYVPVDEWLRFAEKLLAWAEDHPFYSRLARRVNIWANVQRVSNADIRWLMHHGGEREPRAVLEEFARWIRRNEMVCYRTGYDFKRGFPRIRVPTAIIFGDLDPLASLRSTRSVYRAARSEYLLWRPVKGNSHLELTMGHDIRQICYDIKNLIEYARTHRHRPPALPRVR